MSRARIAGTGAAVACLLVTTMYTVPGATAAAGGADLVTTTAAASPTEVRAGDRLTVRAAVRNTGRTKARATQTRFWLSADRSRSGNDYLLGAAPTKALRPGAKVSLSKRVEVPGAVGAGQWFVIACADAARTVREAREGNNCAVGRSRVRVTKPQAPGGPGVFPMQPDPLDVDYTVHADRAVSADVFGGDQTITATAPDGTTFALTLPMGALLSTQTITMTPVAKIDGYPLTSLLGAVEIQPHGLVLEKPATLVITPPGTAPAGAEAFMFDGTGGDFHLYPKTQAGGVTMELWHFSTAGAGTATPPQVAAVDARPARDVRAQYASKLAESVRSGDGAQVAQLLRAYWDDVVQPLLDRAETDHTLAREAIVEALGMERQGRLLGLPEGTFLTDEVWDQIERIIRNAIEKSYARCVDRHELPEITNLIAMERQLQLLGITLVGIDPVRMALSCATFKVTFSTAVTERESWPLAGHEWGSDLDASWRVSSRGLELTPDPMLLSLAGRGVLDYDHIAYERTDTHRGSTSHCPVYTNRTVDSGTSAGVTSAHLALDLNQYRPAAPGVAPVQPTSTLRVSLGDTSWDFMSDEPFVLDAPSESYRTTGGCLGDVDRTHEQGLALSTMGFVHGRTDYPGRAGGKVQVGGQSIMARFGAADADGATLYAGRYTGTVPDLCATGTCVRSADTRLTLTHAPKPIR